MPDDPPIRLEITYQFDDLVGAAAQPPFTKMRWSWHQLIFWGAGLGLLGCVFAMFHGEAPGRARADAPEGAWSATSFIMPILMVAAILAMRAHTTRRVRKSWEKQALRPFAVSLSPAGLVWEAENIRHEQGWTDYRSAVESDKAFVLYTIKGGEIILPKRVMTDGQMAVIRMLLASTISADRGFPVLPPVVSTGAMTEP